MKRLAFLAVVLLPIFLLVSYCSGVGKMEYDKQNSCEPQTTSSVGASGSGISQTISKSLVAGLSNEQLRIAAKIMEIGYDRQFSRRDIKIALMVGKQESNLRNLKYGDRDSQGIYQQRPSQGWGTVQQVTTPSYAINKFYDALSGQKNRKSRSLLDVALSVQRPSYAAYTSPSHSFMSHESVSELLLTRYETRTGQAFLAEAEVVSTSVVEENSVEENCEESDNADRIERMVRAAESQVGSSSDEYGADLIAAAAKKGDMTLPSSVAKLWKYTGNKDEGVTARLLTSSEVKRGNGLKRGDIVFYEADGQRHTAIYTGSTGGLIRIASFNILGSNHGSPVPWPERLRRSISEIEQYDPDVIGLQELRGDQRSRLGQWMRKNNWEIYPKRPVYGVNISGAESTNSIIWDNDRFKLVGHRSIPMPCYFHHCNTKMPGVLLRERATGDAFWVLNTHDPAHARNAAKRLRNWQSHPRQIMKLKNEFGVPVMFTGDFNSGLNTQMGGGNVTPGRTRANLAYCVITRSGDVQHAADAWKGRSGCSRQTSRDRSLQSIDHVFVTQDVRVSNYRVVRSPRYSNGADHPLVIADTALENTSSTASSMMVGVNGAGAVRSVKMPRRLQGVLRLTATDTVPVSATVGGTGKWAFPLPKGSYTFRSNSYGPRTHPVTGRPDFHNGTDFSSPCGTRYVAMNNGKVVDAQYDSAWGNRLIIDYGKTMSLYAHLSAYAPGLKVGDTVKSGQYVGNVGTTGLSTGCHLHLTIGDSLKMLYGDKVGTVDPVPFLDSVGIKP